MANDVGDFEEIESEKSPQTTTEEISGGGRVRFPRENQVIGTIIQRLGGNRMLVHTPEGKQLNCRVPGRFKRTLWLREKDVVMVEPWEFDPTKGDVVYKYNPSEIAQLKKRGLLKEQQHTF